MSLVMVVVIQQQPQQPPASPQLFISYHWGKQPQIKALYSKLTSLGYSCWLDVEQMGGGDPLNDKIDRGIRGCQLLLSCVTREYALSATCRLELAHPIIIILIIISGEINIFMPPPRGH